MAQPINIRHTLGLEEVSGTNLISVTRETVVALTGGKKNPHQGRVTKLATSQAMIFNTKNANVYQNMVNRRLEKEGKPANFQVKLPPWSTEKIIPGIVKYIPKTNNPNNEPKYYFHFIKTGKETVQYFLDGKPIDESEIIGLKERKPDQDGLEDKVEVRKVKIENLVEISANRRKIRGPFTFE